MNKRRELILQRLSRIDSIQTAQSNPRATKFRGRPEGALSIEAAIGTYMTGTPNAVDMYMKQDVYTKSRSGQKKANVTTNVKADGRVYGSGGREPACKCKIGIVRQCSNG